jgi:hypothetical protein
MVSYTNSFPIEKEIKRQEENILGNGKEKRTARSDLDVHIKGISTPHPFQSKRILI